MWALIDNDVVAEVTDVDPAGRFHTNLNWVLVPLDTPNVAQDWSYAGGVFSPPPAPPGPTRSQQAAMLMTTGLHITSTDTPTLDGWYAVDDSSRANIVAIETSLNAGRGFPPAGAVTFNYPDMSFFTHTFTADQFTNFAAAVRDFYYTCAAYSVGSLDSLPSGEATIP